MKLGHFLTQYPQFHFDAEEYLRSKLVVSSLVETLRDFSLARHEMLGVDTYAKRLIQGINEGRCNSIPAYRHFSAIESLQDLPLLEKSELMRRGREYISPEYSPDQLWVKMTTGSSGPPLPVFFSVEFYFDFFLLSLQKVAMTAGVLDMQRRVFCVALSGNLACREYVAVDPSKSIGLFVQVIVEEDNPNSIRRAIQLIRELQPVCVSSKPTIYELLCSVASDSIYSSGAPEIVVSGGAEVSSQLKADLEFCLSSRVIDTYGMTEFGVIASESESGELLVDTSAFAIEVLDESGNVAPPGQVGELVISSLKNGAMPFLRYKTQDLGALDSTGTRLERFIGRKIRCFKLPDGSLFSPTFFNDLFMRFGSLAEFQLVQTQPSRFELYVDLKGNREADLALPQKIAAYVSESIPGKPDVSVVLGIPRHAAKFERFKTYCN